MTDSTAARLLAAYDSQLRTDAEVTDAIAVTPHGPLLLATFAGGQGFVTYRDLGGSDARAVRQLVADAREHFDQDPAVTAVEWKTRGHDVAPGLHDALVEHGFVAGERESIMLGEARLLALDLPVPDGVVLRTVADEADVRAMSAAADGIFGDRVNVARADRLLERLAADDGTELWVAEADGTIVTTGRLDPVAESDFAGLWGGATRPEWRGRGIYRALTAGRAKSALALGKTFLHSDSTDFSRPILERSGFVAASTTTPYEWTRAS
jgi:N-acetylglutamate synthase-like GNAT family acetyltransferase